MIDNILLAVTNCFGLFPFYAAVKHHDLATAILIFTAGSMSTIAHLFESHDHGLTGLIGFGTSAKTSLQLQRISFTFELLLLIRICELMPFSHYRNYIFEYYTCCLFLFLGECAGNLGYIVFHSQWHVGIYIILTRLLEDYYNR